MPLQLDDYRLLGNSGLRISPLTLGTMTFGVQAGWGSDEATAKQILDHYIGQAAHDSRRDINLATGRLREATLAIADEVSAIARENGCTPAQVALAWTLLNRAVTSTIIGVRTLEQLQDNLAALAVELSDAQRARLDAISRIELGFPHDLLNSPVMHSLFGEVRLAKRDG